jgi:hypothetical protein
MLGVVVGAIKGSAKKIADVGVSIGDAMHSIITANQFMRRCVYIYRLLLLQIHFLLLCVCLLLLACSSLLCVAAVEATIMLV